MKIFYANPGLILGSYKDDNIGNTLHPGAHILLAPEGWVLPEIIEYAPPPNDSEIVSREDILPPNVTDLKTCATLTARAYREASKGGTFTSMGWTFDANIESRENIAGASLLATQATMIQQPFTIDWTDADGFDRTLDGAAMMQLGQDAAIHAQTAHSYYKYHKGLISAATSAAEVLAITEAFVW